MELQKALEIANEIVGRVKPFCKQVEIAGSIRRNRPEVRDIDIVLIPADAWNLYQQIMTLKDYAGPAGAKIERFSYKGIGIDLYYATTDTWGIILLVRTGSIEHNKKLVARAKDRGLRFSVARGIEDRDGKLIASKTEEEIFKSLGLDSIPPEERETPAGKKRDWKYFNETYSPARGYHYVSNNTAHDRLMLTETPASEVIE